MLSKRYSLSLVAGSIFFTSLFFNNCYAGKPVMTGGVDRLSLIAAGQAKSYESLKAEILQPKCLGCHANYGTYSGLMSSGAVIAKNPEGSPFFQRTSSGSMPKNGSPLSIDEVDSIYVWIALGAPETGSGPAPSGGGGSGPAPTPVPQSLTPTFTSLQSNIFIPKCIACHQGANPPAGYDLTTYNSVTAGGRVVAGSPSASRLFHRVNDGTMPPSGALSSAEQLAISQWISDGALNSGTNAPPPPPTPVPTPPPAVGVPSPTFAYLNSAVFIPKCSICHQGAGAPAGYALTSHSSVVGSGRVIAGNPAGSRLFLRVNDNSMPPGGPAISATDKQMLSQWIANGALDNGDAAANPSATPPPLPPLGPTYTSVRANILVPKCLSCHSGTRPSAGIDLSTYENVFRRVTPGNSGSSDLYDAVRENEMPAAGTPLTSAQKQALSQWINNGARND